MHLNDYQTKSRLTAKYPIIGHAVVYPTLGLANEAGEVAGKIKKVFRDKEGEINAETRKALKAELGDVLWYLAQVTFLIRHFSQFTLHAMQIWIQESQPQ